MPDEGEFAGQTRFLTMSDIFKDAQSVMSRLRFSIEEDFTALLLMTDGVSDPMFETDTILTTLINGMSYGTKFIMVSLKVRLRG